MPQYARIKLTSANVDELDRVAWEIKRHIGEDRGQGHRPATSSDEDTEDHYEESPHGRGYPHVRHWQLRIHRRILDIEPNERTMRQITKLRIPEEVKIELTLTS